jgi:Zn-dependent protease/predicted transcriptional regulator
MQTGTVGMGSVFGVPIRLHFTFILLLVLLAVYGLNGTESGLMQVLYIALLFFSVLLHEIGHALVSKRFGIRTIEIVVFPIGGISRMERQPKPQEEFWIALSGPMVNLAIALALYFYIGSMHGIGAILHPTGDNLAQRVAEGNLILAVFNMLPAYPMDGGRVMRSVLARFRPEAEATRIAAASGRLLAMGLAIFAIVSGQYLLLFIAFFVYLGATQETLASTGRMLTQGVPVRSAMVTDFRTLVHGQTIREAADLLLATSQQDFPVMLGEQVMGLLGRNLLLRGLAASGPEAYIAGIMDREFPRVEPDQDLAEAMPILARSGSCALVMQDEKLLGMLTTENLSEFLVLRQMGFQK